LPVAQKRTKRLRRTMTKNGRLARDGYEAVMRGEVEAVELAILQPSACCAVSGRL